LGDTTTDGTAIVEWCIETFAFSEPPSAASYG
jgi:hypothetical protein